MANPTKREVNQSLEILEALSGKKTPEHWKNKVAPPRQIVKRTDPDDTEAAVWAEIEKVIREHPKVRWAIKINSGEAEFSGDGFSGDRRFAFWKWVRRPEPRQPYRMPDYLLQLADNRLVLIEAKRRHFKLIASDNRALAQLAMLKASNSPERLACSGADAWGILDAL